MQNYKLEALTIYNNSFPKSYRLAPSAPIRCRAFGYHLSSTPAHLTPWGTEQSRAHASSSSLFQCTLGCTYYICLAPAIEEAASERRRMRTPRLHALRWHAVSFAQSIDLDQKMGE